MKLTAEVYRGTVHFPRHELSGLASQIAEPRSPRQVIMRKAKVTLRKEFSHFLFHAWGSLLIAEELQYLSREDGQRLSAMCEGIGRALNGLMNSLCGKVA
jgi:four helix bundle protein